MNRSLKTYLSEGYDLRKVEYVSRELTDSIGK